MPCFPPLRLPVRRYVRGLFKRGTPRAPSRTTSSATDLPAAVPNGKEKELANVVYEEVNLSKSLVCQFCWETGLFAPGSFQDAWAAQTQFTGFSYSTTWSQVQKSADSGCQWCSLLLSTKNEGMLRDAVEITAGFRTSTGNNAATPKGVQTLKLTIDDIPHSTYYVYTSSDDPAAALVVARARVLQLNTPPARFMASECIMNCIRNHERCPSPHNAVLPTRVIDCSDPTKPKLHLGNGEKAPYVVLSYVWGEEQPHATTTENLDAYLQGIDMDVLPQTIKDAIESTYAFGVRYLWVDALCILQDSKVDRASETAKLRTVLRNAYFTIVAAGANKVSEGFLQDRPEPSPPDIALPFRCPDGQIGTMSLSPAWRQYDGSSEPVNERAWCLEERLLSPRALVYASHTLQFQCRTSVANIGKAVCGPMVGQRLPDILFRTDADLPSTLSAADQKTVRWSWIEAVGDYTHRSSTNPGDKLVAFAAMAELFHRVWKTDYLAGLWRNTLIQDLLWYKTFETRLPRPKYRAPSWSWAAVEGRVMAYSVDDRLDPDSNHTEACGLVSCDVALESTFLPFGAVTSGTLRLRAAMLKATWNPESSMPDLHLRTSGDAAEPQHIGCAYPDCAEEVAEVWAVPIQWNRDAHYAAGIIVSRHAGDGEGQYRRVGFFHSAEDASGGLGWMLDAERKDIVLV